MQINQTAKDAFQRISLARMGCLTGGPSLEYLEKLRLELYNWISSVEKEIHQKEIK